MGVAQGRILYLPPFLYIHSWSYFGNLTSFLLEYKMKKQRKKRKKKVQLA